MGITELKNKVHQQIENSDEKILIQISKILENLTDSNSDHDAIINELLELSEKQYKEGKTESYQNILNESKSKYF